MSQLSSHRFRHLMLVILVLPLIAGCLGDQGNGDDEGADSVASPTTVTAAAATTTLTVTGVAAGSPVPTQVATPSPTVRSTPATSPATGPTPNVGSPTPTAQQVVIEEFPVPDGTHPHDVAPASDGTVWFTAQFTGELGRFDPASGETRLIALGPGSRPHGVIVGPDGAAWVTDGGLNAIVRVDGTTEEVAVYRLPGNRGNANLNTATFDGNGVLWFTGQNGIYGRFDPQTTQMEVYDAPKGRGPYGIATTPNGDVYYASLAGSYVGKIDVDSGEVTVLEPPTQGQGARRVWSDSQGRIWVSEWDAGQVAVFDPATSEWREWRLPGDSPKPYAVFVDDQDMVWLSDFGANAYVRFDPRSEQFDVYPLPSPSSSIRQILGRPGEVWGAGSGVDTLIVARTS